MRILLLLFVTLLSAQPSFSGEEDSGKLHRGPSRAIGKGHAYAWITTDNDARPIAIGVTLSKNTLRDLPNAITEYSLALPKRVPPFDHIAVDWNPAGHEPPGTYDAPHFDFHFYWISRGLRQEITCAGADLARCETPALARYVPDDYIQTPGGVPRMGAHWIDLMSPEFRGEPFTATLIYGSYNGLFTFVEPMVTRAFLLTKPSFSAPIKQAAIVARTGHYPTQYKVTYDSKKEKYVIALTGFIFREAEE